MSQGGRFAFRTHAELGLEGPEAATLWEYGCRGVAEEGREVIGYFDHPIELPLRGRWLELADEDYLERYYRELEPVLAGTLVVAPTHRQATLSAGQKPLWIDPGMAFGTGHHETTRLALEALCELDLERRAVLDVGAGSGILAIAADLLGARESRGIDIDPETVPIARANAALNRSRAQFEPGTLDEAHSADVVVANLHAELHVELAAAYARATLPNGHLLLTGILGDRTAMVEEALRDSFELHGWSEAGEWRLLHARRSGAEGR
ncbi:MAG TPA: 50S ribosomal protein L11 methyltransferase [Trueperaceae bacterium]